MTILSLLDIALGVTVLGLVAAMLWTADRTRMAMLFIALGGVVALVWLRLGAPDVALAEAAVGSALTGALFLRAQATLPPSSTSSSGFTVRALVVAISVGLFLALSWVLLSLDWQARPGLDAAVSARLAESGVSNPVTAVLLNFRGYDTLLEVAVLLVATATVWSLGVRSAPPRLPDDDLLILALLRPLAPLLCVVAGYLLWLGAFAPGGAFQAGAVLSAALLMLLVGGVASTPGSVDTMGLRATLVAGLTVFVIVAGVTALRRPLLQFPAGTAKDFILLVESALTFSVAFTFVVMFLGGRPPAGRSRAS